MVAHTFNPRTWEAKASKSHEFETNLIFRVSSRTCRATERNPVLKNKSGGRVIFKPAEIIFCDFKLFI